MAARLRKLQFQTTRRWKRLAVFGSLGLFAFGGLALAQLKPDTTSLAVQPITITATPITAFEPTNPAAKRFGRLEWRGGLVLKSNTATFGGWSGLAMAPDGQSFIAVSDAGTWLEGQLTYNGDAPAGITAARTGPLKARDGSALSRKRDRDAEAVALASGTPTSGSLLIAFEQNDRIGRFASNSGGVAAPSAYIDMPAESKSMRIDGFESVTVMSGGPNKGSMIAFAEHAKSGSDHALGWIWQNGSPKPIELSAMAGFDVTDVASLPDGRLLVLERRFRWREGVKMRLRVVKADGIKPGAVLEGDLLLAADLNQEIDNMEGLSVSRGAHGETVLTLISDDNFNAFLQRTVLLQFTLADEK